MMSDADVQALRDLLPQRPEESGVEWAVRAYRCGLVNDQEEAWLERNFLGRSPVQARGRQAAVLAALLGLGEPDGGW